MDGASLGSFHQFPPPPKFYVITHMKQVNFQKLKTREPSWEQTGVCREKESLANKAGLVSQLLYWCDLLRALVFGGRWEEESLGEGRAPSVHYGNWVS